MSEPHFFRKFILVISVLVATHSLQAASFIVPPDAVMVHAADAIILATVESAQPQYDDDGEIITIVSLRIDSVLKGDLSIVQTVRVLVPGGIIGNEGRRVSGVPAYWPNGRVLVFLKRNGGNLWVTWAEALGKFESVRHEGVDLWVRGLPEEEIFGWDHRGNRHHERARTKEGFLTFIRRTLDGVAPESDYFWPEVSLRTRPASSGDLNESSRTRPADDGFAGSNAKSADSPYTHYPPSAYLMGSTTKFRWDLFDRGGTAGYRVSGSQPGYDSTGAAQRGLAAWTNDPGSNIRVSHVGSTSAGFTQDGINAIVFNSSISVPAGAIGYSQIFSSGVHTYKGETFYTIVEGDVVMRSGLSVSASTFEEAVTHELGHSLGFRHSDQGTPSSSTAVMNSVVNGRYGANLQAWDREAAGHVYTETAAPCALPSILTQPQSMTIVQGQSATLVVSASGATAYQWFVGASGNTASPVTGATGSSLSVAPSSTTSYWVRVTNSCGSVNSGTAIVNVTSPPTTGVRQKTPVDFNGDRVSDVVVYRSGAWLWPATGAGVWTGQPGTNCIPVPADYDGDGRTDLSLYCHGAWHFFQANGTYLKGIWTGAVAGQVPAPADYDGDGTDDVVVFRTGAWIAYDYNTGSVRWSIWTGPADLRAIPVPMDYDGNGRADFSIYLAGAWNFYRSDGSYLKGIWTGAAGGNIPVPGDYSGDGFEEVVVFNGGAWRFFDFTSGAQRRGVWTGAQSVNGDPLQPAPLDYDGDGAVEFTIHAGGPWHFFHDDGSYRNGIWSGAVRGDRALSRRQHTTP